MKSPAPWSIRTLSLLLVLLASLPVVCILLYTGVEQQREARKVSERLSAWQASSLARLQERAVADARQLLGVVAELPKVRRQDGKACNELFRELLRQNPKLDNLLAATADGEFYASGLPLFPHNARDRRYFQEALRTKRFSAGEFVVARNSRRPALHFALPVLDAAGRVEQVLTVGLALDRLDLSFEPKELSPGTSILVLDHAGTRLWAYPAAPTGNAFPGWPFPGDDASPVRGQDASGASIRYARRSLRLPQDNAPYLTVLAHLPETASLTEARRTLWRNLALLGATMLATTGALLAGTRGLVHPLRRLLAATRPLTDGRTVSPMAIGPAPAEVEQLASAFETLAETSAAREAERRQTAASLLQSEQRYRAMVANAPLGIFHFNKQAVIQECNDDFAAIIGAPRGRIPGFNMLQPLVAEQVRLAILEALCGRRGFYEGAYDTVIVPGRTAQVRLHTYGIHNPDGAFLGGVGIVENNAARQRADLALKESEARYQGLFRNSPDCIFWISVGEDGQFIVDSINPAQEAATGLPAAAMVGKPLHAFLPAVFAQAREADYRRCAQEARSITYENQVDFMAGAPVYQTLLVPLTDARGRVDRMVGISRNITQLKVAEEAMRQSQKLESLGVLAGGIAHDFNNLLTAILGNLDLAQSQAPPEPKLARYLENAVRTTLKASELTKQMLAYSGKGHFMVEPQDLNKLVREMTHLLQVSLSKNATLDYHLAEALPAFEADSAQVQQVIMNLVTNAAEAIAEQNGVIRISTRLQHHLEQVPAGSLAMPLARPGPWVVLEVQDTGCGMPQAVLERIFDPFFTTKLTGRGLGLSAMQGILRGHHAGLQVVSQAGAGSTFRIFFPASQEPLPALAAGPFLAELPLYGTILLVDDEFIVIEALTPALEAMGFQVVVARDGLDAVALYREASHCIDLVLMDLTMPRLNGREAFATMRAIRPDARIILTSGYNEQETLQGLPSRELAGFIQKPFLLKDLRAVLQSALQGRLGESGDAAGSWPIWPATEPSPPPGPE